MEVIRNQIVRDFDVSYNKFQEIINLERATVEYWRTTEERFVVKEDYPYGELILPVIHPQSATEYFGFYIHEDEGILVAALAPPSTYKYYEKGQWHNCQQPIFQAPEMIRAGMPLWEGPIQFHLLLARGARYKTLNVGYEVPRDLLSYLVEFALPCHFKPLRVRLARQIYSTPDGEVYFPDGFDVERTSNLKLQLLEKLPVPVTLRSDRVLDVVLSPNTPVQLVFDIEPLVRKRNTTQIEYLPNVFLDVQDAINGRQLMLSQGVPIDCGEKIFRFDESNEGIDLPIDVQVTAAQEDEANAVAFSLRNYIENNGCLRAPAFDLEFGLRSVGLIKGISGSGGLPTKRFRMLITNISL
jgi:hypothetical protein